MPDAMDRTDAVTFYDAISGAYDAAAGGEDSLRLRRAVEQLFGEYVRGKNVVDFGGGTGLDLEWLLRQPCRVHFWEPSPGMRRFAEARLRSLPGSDAIIHSDAVADLAAWSGRFRDERIDAVLANFNVLNQFAVLPTFFSALENVLRPGGVLLATVLNPRRPGLYRQYFLRRLAAALTGGTAAIPVRFGDASMTAYLHTLRDFRRAASPGFELRTVAGLPDHRFLALVFARKG